MELTLATLPRLQRLVIEEQTARQVLLLRGSTTHQPVVKAADGEPTEQIDPSQTVSTNPNEAMAARKVLRTAQLQSVANWLLAEITRHLDTLESELVGLLRSESPHLDNLDKVKERSKTMIDGTFEKMKAECLSHFKELAGIIYEKNRAHLYKHHGVQTWPNSLDDILNTSVLGATLSDHFDKMASDLAFKFNATVRTGIEAGDTLDELVKRVKGGLETVVRSKGFVHAGDAWSVIHPSAIKSITKASDLSALSIAIGEEMERRGIVRAADPETEAAIQQRLLMDTVTNSINKVIQAAMTAFANEVDSESADSVMGEEGKMGWIWVAVMDIGTCDECKEMDGNQWNADYEPIGDAPDFEVQPPLHFGCRCSCIPCSLDADAPEPKSFEDYLSQFSNTEQKQAFGAENVSAYRRGDITASQLIGQDSNLMTLEGFKAAL